MRISDWSSDVCASDLIPERVIGERRSYRAVWVSDIHLGTRGCNTAMLIDFFDHVDCETLYLVGDIIDGWRLKKRHFWPPQHNDVVWLVLKRAKLGKRGRLSCRVHTCHHMYSSVVA